MAVGKLIGTLFLSRDVAHREHLKTNRYAVHMALGSFYEDIICVADKLTESYQGRNGIIEDIPILTNDRPNSDIIKILEYHLAQFEKARYTALGKDDAPLQSIADEVVAVYLSTLYKLRQLR